MLGMGRGRSCVRIDYYILVNLMVVVLLNELMFEVQADMCKPWQVKRTP